MRRAAKICSLCYPLLGEFLWFDPNRFSWLSAQLEEPGYDSLKCLYNVDLFSASPLPLLLEIVVGLLSPFCTGMFRPQHAFLDSQGTLIERLGLLILALPGVEVGQVLPGGRR